MGASYLQMERAMSALFNNVDGPNSCRSIADATEQFAVYLSALAQRQPLGLEAFHSFPQALKIDHVAWSLRARTAPRFGRRFDAIAAVENITYDLSQIRGQIGSNQSDPAWQQMLNSEHHSHQQSSCALVDWSNPSLKRTLCDIYHVDFVCFGYVGYCDEPS
jgi:hypothetical protein